VVKPIRLRKGDAERWCEEMGMEKPDFLEKGTVEG
jgi:hypothetical protein